MSETLVVPFFPDTVYNCLFALKLILFAVELFEGVDSNLCEFFQLHHVSYLEMHVHRVASPSHDRIKLFTVDFFGRGMPSDVYILLCQNFSIVINYSLSVIIKYYNKNRVAEKCVRSTPSFFTDVLSQWSVARKRDDVKKEVFHRWEMTDTAATRRPRPTAWRAGDRRWSLVVKPSSRLRTSIGDSEVVVAGWWTHNTVAERLIYGPARIVTSQMRNDDGCGGGGGCRGRPVTEYVGRRWWIASRRIVVDRGTNAVTSWINDLKTRIHTRSRIHLSTTSSRTKQRTTLSIGFLTVM